MIYRFDSIGRRDEEFEKNLENFDTDCWRLLEHFKFFFKNV